MDGTFPRGWVPQKKAAYFSEIRRKEQSSSFKQCLVTEGRCFKNYNGNFGIRQCS